MVVLEEASTEYTIENHEEFVDAEPETEPVFTVESILLNMFDGFGSEWWCVL
jgi:hypothetical protein